MLRFYDLAGKNLASVLSLGLGVTSDTATKVTQETRNNGSDRHQLVGRLAEGDVERVGTVGSVSRVLEKVEPSRNRGND